MKSFLTKNFFPIVIITIAALLRFWQLGQNPPGLFVDEASNGYNAYSILKTAKDEYGNFLPLTFRAFGDYNPALSVYLLVPSIAVFGLTEFAVRFPSALLGTLTVVATYFLTKKLFENEKIALLAMLFLAISPWHLQFSRFDHEANFMAAFVVVGITFFLYCKNRYPRPIRSETHGRRPKGRGSLILAQNSLQPRSRDRGFFAQNNYKMLILSAISFGLGLNTYHGAKIWVPLVLAALVFLYRRELIHWGTRLLLPIFILFLAAIPTAANLDRSTIRARSAGIFEKEEPQKLFISGYLSHFSPNFLFVTPDNIGRHAVGGMGHLYVFELPLIFLGILFLIRNKSPHRNLIILWLLLAPIPAALATPTPHALRSITFLPVFSILAALGLVAVIKARLNFRLKSLILACLLLVAAYNIATYFHLYYKHYPKLKAADWNGGTKEMVEFMNRIKDKYEVVAITDYYTRPYIFVLFYTKYDPAAYHPQSEDKTKFDKFEFFGSSWDKKATGTALVVRPHWQKPNPPPKYIKEIYDSASTLVFRISEEQ
ncbi:glycosyltransferase family 39 protein [Candidatus Curtissbacteria bacterium]|nr:glycosyltransferase family 39 protein [Candidatus Curtissbacteria bacterium]